MRFHIGSKNCGRAGNTDEYGKCVPEFRTRNIEFKITYSSILKGFKEITSGCPSGSNLVNSCVRVKIVVEVTWG